MFKYIWTIKIMKSEKGITLASLLVYVLMFSTILGFLTTMTNYIYGNLENINSESISAEEFNKFNVNFIKDVKNNKDANISLNDENISIVFQDSVNYNYISSEKAIYRNKVKIADKIIGFSAENIIINNKSVIKISIITGKQNNVFDKTINYAYKYW